MANILLFSPRTGQLECVVDGTLITAWRTASASIVATKYLYFSRESVKDGDGVILAILGCGAQGESHALGMCSKFKVNEIRLWNRTTTKAHKLAAYIETQRHKFVNPDMLVAVSNSIRTCVGNADIIVTATPSTESLLHLDMLKENVHINAVGVSRSNFFEIAQDVYDSASVYIDNWTGAKTELKDLKADIVSEVGKVILKKKYPSEGITIFQPLGMAAEDATVAQSVYQKLIISQPIDSTKC